MKIRSKMRSSAETAEVNLLHLTKSPCAIVPQQELPPLWVNGLAWLIMKPWRVVVTLCMLDVLSVSMGIVMAFLVRSYVGNFEHSLSKYISVLICYSVIFITIHFFHAGYGKISSKRPEDELRAIVLSSSYAFLILLTIIFISYKYAPISRSVIILAFVISTPLLVSFRLALRSLVKKLWAYGFARENVIIIGSSLKDINWVLNHLNIQRHHRFNILGYVAGRPLESIRKSLKYLGTFEDLARLKEMVRVDKVFFAMQFDSDRHQTLINRLEKCSQLNISALIISQIFNTFHFALTLDGYTGVFEVNPHNPGYISLVYNIVKRAMDIGFSLIILLASLPIWVVAIIGIKWHDRGPIFFRHRLVGKDGKLIDIIKFRTMVENAQEVLRNNPELYKQFLDNYKLENDPRITPIGKLLRKTSLDELPQLINILKGDMSLVGPRPVREDELERFGDFKHERVKVRPGLTGFWQVSGRCSTSYEERIQMDKFYLNRCSVWLDLVILLKTPSRILKGEGAM